MLREKRKSSKLQKRVDEIAATLQKEQATCDKHRVELKEALTKQIQIMEEREKLAVALQKAEDCNTRLQEQQRAEARYQFKQLHDKCQCEQQKTALEESKTALNELQQNYTALGRRHSDVSSKYCEVLTRHNTLLLSDDKLRYAQLPQQSSTLLY
ncbi:golgin subfamily A member 6-like protein 22 [Scomber scombrus]